MRWDKIKYHYTKLIWANFYFFSWLNEKIAFVILVWHIILGKTEQYT